LGPKRFPDHDSRFLWVVRYVKGGELGGGGEALIGEVERAVREAGKGWRVGVVDCGRAGDFCEAGRRKGYVWTTVSGGKEREVEVGGKGKLREELRGRVPDGTVVDVNKVGKLKRIVGEGGKGKVISVLLTDKYETPGAWIRQAHKDRGMGRFAVVRGKNLEFGREFEVKRYPVVVVLRGVNPTTKPPATSPCLPASPTFLPYLNTLSFVLCLLGNALGGSGRLWGKSIGEISDEYNSYFTPGGGAFGIWSFIYILMTGFVGYQHFYLATGRGISAAPAAVRSVLVDDVGNMFALSCFLNAGWIIVFTAGTTAAMVISSLVLFSLLSALLSVYASVKVRSATTELPPACKVVVDVLFSVYAGWVAVASIVGVAVAIIALGFDGGEDGDKYASAMLVVALVIFVFTSVKYCDPAFVWVLTWASYFIASKDMEDLNTTTLRGVGYGVCGCSGLVGGGLLAWRMMRGGKEEGREALKVDGGGAEGGV
ncbi:hypothetical protein TrRE_jg12494, partial [Triparma retinervis]